MLQQKLFSNQTQPFVVLSSVVSQFVLLQWMSIVRELQFTFFSSCINCSREKTIGFPLFQYRLVKTHLEILWGCICWCLTKIHHSEGVSIGFMATETAIANLKWLIFQNERNYAQFMGLRTVSLIDQSPKYRKNRINYRLIVFSSEFYF